MYAHELEIPYLTGQKSYSEPDATIKMSPLFPNEPINLGKHVEVLSEDGSVPHLPAFRWIHTPGDAEGHVSLFREEDKVLLTGMHL